MRKPGRQGRQVRRSGFRQRHQEFIGKRTRVVDLGELSPCRARRRPHPPGAAVPPGRGGLCVSESFSKEQIAEAPCRYLKKNPGARTSLRKWSVGLFPQDVPIRSGSIRWSAIVGDSRDRNTHGAVANTAMLKLGALRRTPRNPCTDSSKRTFERGADRVSGRNASRLSSARYRCTRMRHGKRDGTIHAAADAWGVTAYVVWSANAPQFRIYRKMEREAV